MVVLPLCVVCVRECLLLCVRTPSCECTLLLCEYASCVFLVCVCRYTSLCVFVSVRYIREGCGCAYARVCQSSVR